MDRSFRPLLRAALPVLALLLLALPVYAQRTKTVKETVRLDPKGEVWIDTYKGSITVTTWDRDEVAIDVRIEADEDEGPVADTEIRIDASTHRLVLETDYDAVNKRRGLFGLKSISLPFAHYTIRMPRTAFLKIDDYKSDTRITGLRSDLNLDTYKGRVEIKDLEGALRLETYKGEVEITFSHLADDSTIETYKGEISLRLPQRDGFDLDTELGRRGTLDTDFSLAGLHRSDHDYRGAVNGGGPRLRLETYKGTYRLYAH